MVPSGDEIIYARNQSIKLYGDISYLYMPHAIINKSLKERQARFVWPVRLSGS